MSQYRDLFLSETREHINNLNQLVVTLEQEPGNRETIDALFREAHSIKGMAATMGFDRTAELSHHLEDMLDGFRATGEVPASTVDYLLAGIDLLDGLLDDLQSNKPERSIDAFMVETPNEEPAREESVLTAEILEEIPAEELVAVAVEGESEEITPADESAPEPEVAPVVKVETEESNKAETKKKSVKEPDVFKVLVKLAENTPAAAARGILVLRELEKSGELMSSKPDMAALRGGAPCQKIQAWLRTSLAKMHIEEALLRISGVVKVRFIDDRRKDESSGRDEGGRTIRVRTDLLDQFVNLTGELITNRYMLHTATNSRDWDKLTQTLSQTSRLIDDLHHQVLQARLMPLENITGRLPRIIRDLSRKTNKEVTLRLTGAEVGIDRVVLEALTDPLVHLVRNAVDHGIEKEGVVTLSARREKDLVLIEVADDGKGMDPEQLRQQAVDRDLMTPSQAASLSDRDALMLVCRPGFSTTEEVTETSGRGVGMDVVKAAVSNLGGSLDIISAPGEGSRFQMRLPLSIAIIKILLVSCAGHPLAIPLTRVQRTLDLPTCDIQLSGQKRVFRLGEEVVSLYSLAEALGLPEVAAGETTWVVLTEVQGRRVGLQVDHFLGQREAFVKALGFPLNLLTGLNGATVEGNGQVVFIVDPQALLENRQLFKND
ncbi:MAG: chemotaxis protein CheA [Desulfuromonadales bacterium]|nr:chemotaxis protein CheA [Desulfuromonadales bacterium]